MRKTAHLMMAATLAGLTALACSEGMAPLADQLEVLAAEQEQLGAMVDSAFGADGAILTASAGVSGAAPARHSLTGTLADTAPTFWGRRRVVRGGPLPIFHRDVTIVGDTATVEHDVTYHGIFLVDTSADGVFNPTSKPLADRMTQRAVLVRDKSRPHGWRVVELSPQHWTVLDQTRQTVAVQDIKIFRNGTLLLEVTDPTALYDVSDRIPRFHVGDEIKVVAAVANTSSGFTPATFVFLHVRHADLRGTSWHRVQMKDHGDGTWELTWIARRSGIDRFVVDALDSATLVLGTADNYRANEVGIPYRIE